MRNSSPVSSKDQSSPQPPILSSSWDSTSNDVINTNMLGFQQDYHSTNSLVLSFDHLSMDMSLQISNYQNLEISNSPSHVVSNFTSTSVSSSHISQSHYSNKMVSDCKDIGTTTKLQEPLDMKALFASLSTHISSQTISIQEQITRMLKIHENFKNEV